MALSSKIVLSLMGVAGTTVLLCAALVFGALDRLALRSAEANVDFLLSQLRDSIEANVGLGLPLADIRVAQSLVEQAKATDKRVLAVEVFSPSGISLFNTDRGAIGEDIPPAWHVAIRKRVDGDRWRVEDLGDIVVGEAMYNDFGETVGHLAITISDDVRQDHAEGLLTTLVSRLALVAPVALVLVLTVAALIFGRTTRDIGGLAAVLEGSSPRATTPLTELAVRVRSTVDQAVGEFDRAASDVLKTDEA
ncbi:MAG: hypothetical protein ACK4U0_10330 [Mesorhizobium sp.]